MPHESQTQSKRCWRYNQQPPGAPQHGINRPLRPHPRGGLTHDRNRHPWRGWVTQAPPKGGMARQTSDNKGLTEKNKANRERRVDMMKFLKEEMRTRVRKHLQGMTGCLSKYSRQGMCQILNAFKMRLIDLAACRMDGQWITNFFFSFHLKSWPRGGEGRGGGVLGLLEEALVILKCPREASKTSSHWGHFGFYTPSIQTQNINSGGSWWQ